MMIAEAINKAGATDPKKILAAAHALGYDGATGKIALDHDNERAAQQYLSVTVKDGKVVSG